MKKVVRNSTKKFESTLNASEKQKHILRLYVNGHTPNSRTAIRNLERVCRDHLEGRYELEIIDIQEHPEAVKQEELFALPTLVKDLPKPLRKLIGDLSDTEHVLIGLGINSPPG